MRAAAAARKHWARRRSGGPAGASMPGRTVARVSTVLLLVLALLRAGLRGDRPEQSPRRDDSRLAAERHAALQSALDELHAVFGDVDRFDAGQVGLIERRTGLDDLRFDADPSADGGREMQSVHDAQGRIVGWFSWTPDRTLHPRHVLAVGACRRRPASRWRLARSSRCGQRGGSAPGRARNRRDDPQADDAGRADRAAQPARHAGTPRRGDGGAPLQFHRLRVDRHRRLPRRQRYARPRRRRHHAAQHRRTAQIRPAGRRAVRTLR